MTVEASDYLEGEEQLEGAGLAVQQLRKHFPRRMC